MDTTYRLTQTGAEVQNLLNQITPMAAEILAKYTKPVDGIPDTDLTTAIQQALTLALTAYQKPDSGIPKIDLTIAVQDLLDAAGTAYQKPGSGIPKTDLTTAVQNLLDAAGTAYQKPASGIPLTDLAASVQAAINASASMAQDLSAERLARETADLQINSSLATKLNQSQVESIVAAALANYDTAAEVATAISTALASYYTKAQSYSKTEVDTLVAPKQTQAQVEAIVAAALADYDTAAEVATAISTALAQYYTKAQTYTKTEVDGLVAPKQTQAQVEAIVSSALASYSTTSEVSAAIASALTDYYTKAAIDVALAGKQAMLQFDQTPTLNSSNPVTSEGIRAAIATAVNGLVNSTYVQNAITTALADYSTTNQVSTLVSTAITTALANYYTKTQVDNIANGKTDKLPMSGAGAATEDDIMVVDVNGNIKDGGKKISDLQLKVTDCAMLGGGFPTCSTAGGTAAKTVTIPHFLLLTNCRISVLFQNAFTASNPTISINGGTAIAIKHFGRAMEIGKVHANTILTMVYDGTYWQVVGIEGITGSTPSGAVDLALPSGLLWCEHNVGAASPYDDGLYFSWGNVEGHTGTDGYDFGTSNDGPYASTPGAALTGNISVDGTYDAARHNMGAPWRMPTQPEFQELYDNCDSEWTDEDGVTGRRFTSRINGNSIFFPASGYRSGTSLSSRGSYGLYWSSSLYSSAYGYSLGFSSGGVNPAYDGSRFVGFSVRAVQ